ncbi:hypothetical protein EYF80_052068 [Liparis tanakae]|uniref:Uncharacterized protein n=1 Tax=Liparis tanakae TaxID=230148 RepID=A0A4Z2F9D1_9TELE|nr:hypothetical protein EYF80_052068 [Liparis tanakae]
MGRDEEKGVRDQEPDANSELVWKRTMWSERERGRERDQSFPLLLRAGASTLTPDLRPPPPTSEPSRRKSQRDFLWFLSKKIRVTWRDILHQEVREQIVMFLITSCLIVVPSMTSSAGHMVHIKAVSPEGVPAVGGSVRHVAGFSSTELCKDIFWAAAHL